MKLLNHFIEAGLNIETGYSLDILKDEMESRCKCRLTGNGSVVRRDTLPWSVFNLENIRKGNSVYSYKFNGYKTRRELIGELRHQNDKSNKRIQDEQRIVLKRNDEIKVLTNSGRLDEIMFSQKDIRKYHDN